MLPINTDGPWTFTAGEAITTPTNGAALAVAFDSSGNIVKCGADAKPRGLIKESCASGDLVTIYPLRGKAYVVASGAITLNDYIKSAAGGKFATDASLAATSLGKARQAATGDDSVFEAHFG